MKPLAAKIVMGAIDPGNEQAHITAMNDILQRAREDLKRLEAAAEEARQAYVTADQKAEDQRSFVLRLELYTQGYSAAEGELVVHRAMPVESITAHRIPRAFFNHASPVLDGLQRRTAVSIPREGTKRYEIGNAALNAIRMYGAIHTADLLKYIPDELFEGSENPKNYLSNALSKDARIVATPQGWDINITLIPKVEAEEKA